MVEAFEIESLVNELFDNDFDLEDKDFDLLKEKYMEEKARKIEERRVYRFKRDAVESIILYLKQKTDSTYYPEIFAYLDTNEARLNISEWLNIIEEQVRQKACCLMAEGKLIYG